MEIDCKFEWIVDMMKWIIYIEDKDSDKGQPFAELTLHNLYWLVITNIDDSGMNQLVVEKIFLKDKVPIYKKALLFSIS